MEKKIMGHVAYERSEAVGFIVINRPPANSYEIGFMRELDAAIEAAETDSECRVVIVRSSLPSFFCGGADIKQFRANAPHENMEMITLAHDTLCRPAQSDKIYIAEIAGHALGGGFEIALACDLRFAARGKYRLGLPEVTLGLLPGNGGTQRLAALIGPNKALELMISGTTVSPEEAHRIGMTNQLFDEAELADQTVAFANQLASAATFAIGRIKRSVYDGFCAHLPMGLLIERQNIAKLFASQDAREGLAAFIERRKATFSGR
jgi:enoyl-CoA hydratase/carnithine racemase